MERDNPFGRRIIEIIHLLVKELLEEEKEISNDEQIVESLVNQGYKLEEINAAFALIFSLEGKIEKNHTDKALENRQSKRFLTPIEKFRLTLEAQGLLIRLTESNLITAHELERVLDWTVKKSEEVDTEDLWDILEKIVDDPVRFVLMTNHQWTVDYFVDEGNRGYLS